MPPSVQLQCLAGTNLPPSSITPNKSPLRLLCCGLPYLLLATSPGPCSPWSLPPCPRAGCTCPWSPLASLAHLDLHLQRLPPRAALLALSQLRLLHTLRLQVAGCAAGEALRAADVLAAAQGLQGLRVLLVRGHAALGDR